MIGLPAARAVYLDGLHGAVFGMFHEPAAQASSDTAVILCSPWGWDEVASYRSRRVWAEDLARAGFPVMRFDFPGTGDSSGAPTDSALLDGWSAAIDRAVTAMREMTGCLRMAVIGLGAGGLAAGHAIGQGVVVDDLVLWATPTRGRAFTRELRAFATLQVNREEPEDPQGLPTREGRLEAGGFVLTAETIEALDAVALDRSSTGTLRRALLLERDGIAVDRHLREHLEAGGVEVTLAAGNGWAAMATDIERSEPPTTVFATVTSWLRLAAGPGPVPHLRTSPEVAHAELPAGRDRIRESAFTLTADGVRLFGVLSEPCGARTSDRCAVFLNAGAIRRIGPNRLWVEAARRAAANGIPAVRVDLEGIGDSDGDGQVYADVRQFYRPVLGTQVRAILDHLEGRGLGHVFTLIGLCSGAYWAFEAAQHEDRVEAAVLFNPRALVWDPHLQTRRQARALRNVRDRATWRRLVRGHISLKRVIAVARAGARHAWWTTTARSPRPVNAVLAALDVLRDRGTRIVLAFGDNEELQTELDEHGLFQRLDRWPNVGFVRLPGADHTVRPSAAQRRVLALLDEELARPCRPDGRSAGTLEHA